MDPWLVARAAYALAAVAATLFALRFVLARLAGGGVRIGRARRIEVLETIALPHDAALSLVRLGARRFVVATGRGAVAAVAEFADDPAPPPAS